MRLLHYSAEPLGKVIDRLEQPTGSFKPVGLWLSVEGPDDWPAWCRGENFGLDRLSHTHDVILRPGAKILHLKNARDIDSMSRYVTHDPAYRRMSFNSLDWRPVAEEYDGIIIAPYIYSRRLHPKTGWYYAWDCASGCIWRARAVERVMPVPR